MISTRGVFGAVAFLAANILAAGTAFFIPQASHISSAFLGIIVVLYNKIFRRSVWFGTFYLIYSAIIIPLFLILYGFAKIMHMITLTEVAVSVFWFFLGSAFIMLMYLSRAVLDEFAITRNDR